MQTQTDAKPAAAKRSRPRPPAARRPEYTAAVRYRDGSRELVRVRNADDMADARALIFAELDDVSSVVIALRH